MFAPFNASNVVFCLISSLFPINWYLFVIIFSFVPIPIQTSPTGLFSLPPVGPAIPVTAIDKFAFNVFYEFLAILNATISLTAPFFVIKSFGILSNLHFISLE